jgi:hypothetical protein
MKDVTTLPRKVITLDRTGRKAIAGWPHYVQQDKVTWNGDNLSMEMANNNNSNTSLVERFHFDTPSKTSKALIKD